MVWTGKADARLNRLATFEQITPIGSAARVSCNSRARLRRITALLSIAKVIAPSEWFLPTWATLAIDLSDSAMSCQLRDYVSIWL
jgi:hypothetical protein